MIFSGSSKIRPHKPRVTRLKDGDVAVRYRDRLYRFKPTDHAVLSHGVIDGSRHCLFGLKTVGAAERHVLAEFDTAKEAEIAHAGVVGAYAGFGGGYWKWPAGVLGIFVAANVLLSSPTSAVATAYEQVPGGVVQQPAMTAPEAAVGFNPNEATLEQLAEGNYQPSIKVKAPDVQAPELNCAQPN